MKRFVLIFSFFLILISCSDVDKSTNIKFESVAIEYAENLSVINKSDGVLIQIGQPETSRMLNYFIPNKDDFEKKKEYIILPRKINKIIALSSTHIGMLSKISELNSLVGVSNKNYINNKEVLKGIERNKIHDFGGEELISFEAIVKSKAQIIIYSGFGKEFPHEEKLKKLGIICIPNYDWKEEHPLGKAEWIKFFGALLAKSEMSQVYFEKLENRFTKLKNENKNHQNKPSLFSGNLTGGIWYSPSGDSYMAQLFEMAGGDYVYKDSRGIGSLSLGLEEVIAKNKKTEFWFNPGFPTKREILVSNPKAQYLEAFQNGNVYCYTQNMNLFWEMGAIEPDKVLSDMINILHKKGNSKKLHFYHKIN